MLEVDQVTSDWSVILAMTDRETSRLFSVVLDGFGYQPLECRNREDIYNHLASTTPAAAVVDARISGSEEICSMIREHGGVSLVILVSEDSSDPESVAERLRADSWEPADAGPEKLLLALRKLFTREAEAGSSDAQIH